MPYHSKVRVAHKSPGTGPSSSVGQSDLVVIARQAPAVEDEVTVIGQPSNSSRKQTSQVRPARLVQGTLNSSGSCTGRVATSESFNHPVLGKYYTFFEKKDGVTTLQCNATNIITNEPCNKMFKLMPLGNYYNLKRHLQRPVHGVNEDKLKQARAVSETGTLAPFRSNYNRGDPAQLAFDKAVRDMICVDGLPLNFVCGPGFQNLVLSLDPRVKIKSRCAYTRQIEKNVSTVVIPQIQSDIAAIDDNYCHVSCDVWSSKRREGILGVVAHYVNKDWQLISQTIAIKHLTERHTGDYIQASLLAVLEKYNLNYNKVGMVVTDNASNMLKAFQMTLMFDEDEESPDLETTEISEEEQDDTIESEDDPSETESNDAEAMDFDIFDDEDVFKGVPLGHHGCASHKLQLVINDSLRSDDEAMALLAYVQSVMVFFKRSSRWSDELRKHTKVDIVMPAKTRWNSMLIVLDRFRQEDFFLSVKTVLESAELEKTTGKAPPDPPTQLILRKADEIHQILRPFGDATDKLQSDGPTANWVIISIVTAFNRVRQVTPTYFKILRESLLVNTKIRLEPVLKMDEFVCANILDPRQKMDIFSFFERSYSESVEESEVLDELVQLKLPTSQEAQSAFQHQYLKESLRAGVSMVSNNVSSPVIQDERPQKDSPNSMLDILLEVRQRRSAPKANEIQEYLEEIPADHDQCELQYWKNKSSKYPILAQLAKKFLAIPASSGGVERVFSITGSLARARRANLKARTLENVILLRQHRRPVILKRLKRTGRIGTNQRRKVKRSSHLNS